MDDISFEFRDIAPEEIPKDFYVGQKVVCIGSDYQGFLQTNRIYVIKKVLQKHQSSTNHEFLELHGKIREYLSIRFRPATREEVRTWLNETT